MDRPRRRRSLSSGPQNSQGASRSSVVTVEAQAATAAASVSIASAPVIVVDAAAAAPAVIVAAVTTQNAAAVEPRLAGIKRSRRSSKLAALDSIASSSSAAVAAPAPPPVLPPVAPVAVALPAAEAAAPVAAAQPVVADVAVIKSALPMETEDPIIISNLVDMFAYFHTYEISIPRASDCLSRQQQLTAGMRAILLDWLIEVARRYRQQPETVFKAVSLVDRFLARGETVNRDNFQCIGSVCLVLASKLDEAYRTEVTYADLADMCAGAYTKAQLTNMEATILRTLDFRISEPTAFIFLTRLQYEQSATLPGPEGEAISLQAQFILERTQLELSLLNTPPSLLAAAAMFLALRSAVALKALQQQRAPASIGSAYAGTTPLAVCCASAGSVGGSTNSPSSLSALAWTDAMAALSRCTLQEVRGTAFALQSTFARGVVVTHNISARVKEAAARAAAASRGDAAPAPRAYSHFQIEAVSRKYSKPEVLEVSKLPLAFEVCLSPPPAMPCGCNFSAKLRFAVLGNTGLVPWVPAPPQVVAVLSTPQASSGRAAGDSFTTPADATATSAELPATLAVVSARPVSSAAVTRSASSISYATTLTTASSHAD